MSLGRVWLETRDLTIRFGAVTAVDRVSVSIRENEVVGLIGANGAGKTTFLNMVTGYLPPTGGTILLDGRDVTGTSPRKMVAQGVARSFQVPQLFPELTVKEHIVLSLALAEQRTEGLFGRLHTFARLAKAETTLERFGLSAVAHRSVGSVPQGQRKLVDIAMALALQPKLIFLDEPTSGVSSAEKGPLMEVVFEAIRANGVTVLFVEHDMEVVARYVTRIMAFGDGRLIADGSPGDVMRHSEVSRAVLGKRKPAA